MDAYPTVIIASGRSIGVIYGDIGTSPLYVYSSTFLYGPPSQDDVVVRTSDAPYDTVVALAIGDSTSQKGHLRKGLPSNFWVSS